MAGIGRAWMALTGGNERGWSMEIGENCGGRSESGCCAIDRDAAKATVSKAVQNIAGVNRIRAVTEEPAAGLLPAKRIDAVNRNRRH